MEEEQLIEQIRGAVGVDIPAEAVRRVLRLVFQELVQSVQQTGRFSLPGVGSLTVQTRKRSALVGSEGHHAPLEYHRVLLGDATRMNAYERAIAELVRPGDVVLDLGCGTGVLAMLAARHGARRVHAVEITAVAGLAEELVRRNGLSDQVHVYHQNFLAMEPVEPVDLIISDFMGSFVVDDGMLPLAEAAMGWLGPGGRFCPAAIDLMLAPVGDIELAQVDLFERPIAQFDFSAASIYTLNFCYVAHLQPTALMAAPQVGCRLRPPYSNRSVEMSLAFPLERSGRLQAMAGWFEAQLTPEVTLSTRPGIRSHWGQYLFPLPPVEVQEGDLSTIRLGKETLAEDAPWRWEGEVLREDRPVTGFALESWQRLGQRG